MRVQVVKIMNCEACKKPLDKHRLAITLHNDTVAPGADVRELANVCSVVCLINWGYNYGTVQAVRGVTMIRSFVRDALAALRGPR